MHKHKTQNTHTHTHTVDGTSMNEECEAVKTTLWAKAPTAGWPPSLRSVIFNVRRRCAPSSHVSNERTQNPMAGKIRDDWWVQPSHGEASRLREPRFWIRVFLLLDRLPAKAHTHTHTHTHTEPFYGPLGFCLGLPGWAGTTEVKPICIYWSKR